MRYGFPLNTPPAVDDWPMGTSFCGWNKTTVDATRNRGVGLDDMPTLHNVSKRSIVEPVPAHGSRDLELPFGVFANGTIGLPVDSEVV